MLISSLLLSTSFQLWMILYFHYYFCSGGMYIFICVWHTSQKCLCIGYSYIFFVSNRVGCIARISHIVLKFHNFPSLHMQVSLRWRHNGRDSVSNLQPHDCLLNLLFRRRSKNASKLSVTGLCAWNSPVTGEFPAQMASNVENVSIWWRHHVV